MIVALIRRFFAAFGIASCLFITAAEAYDDQITLFVPAFEGPSALGRSVSTILNLQIWQTLRKAPYPNPKELSFGKGLIIWEPKPLPHQSYRVAAKFAKQSNILAQFVLWGKVYQYGGGAIAQTYLTIPKYFDFREQRHEKWTVRIPLTTGEMVVTADLPQRRYAFEPIILKEEIIKQYTLPNSLVMYKTENIVEETGRVGNEYVAIEQRPNMVYLRSTGVSEPGWVRLPMLSDNRSEVVDFVGGVIRIFRSDWDGAEELLKEVVKNRNTPNELKVDSHLLMALAKSKKGLSSKEDAHIARRLNPYAKRSIIYSIMSGLADFRRALGREADIETHRNIVSELKTLIKENRYLFLENDPWLQHVTRGLNQIEESL
jgi:hypothetical protein